ncbi:24797_t:CDS:1, partial [Gigaspora margarita]
ASQFGYNEFSLDSTLNSQQTLDGSQSQFIKPDFDEINPFQQLRC